MRVSEIPNQAAAKNTKEISCSVTPIDSEIYAEPTGGSAFFVRMADKPAGMLSMSTKPCTLPGNFQSSLSEFSDDVLTEPSQEVRESRVRARIWRTSRKRGEECIKHNILPLLRSA